MWTTVNHLTFLILLYLLLFQNAASTVCRVLVQPPWPNRTLVPLRSSNVKLQCMRSMSGHLFLWIRRENEIDILIQHDNGTLGLYLSKETSLSQFLTINKTSVNNNTMFSCSTSLSGTNNIQSTNLIVYQPTLTISDISVQSVNISWSELSDNYYQPMENYTLTVHNINESSRQTFSLNDSFYVFTSKKDNSSCAVFNFSVLTSFTSSIHSGNCISVSNTVKTMLPSLPNITLLDSSINVALSRGVGSFLILSVSFLPASTCSNMYRVTSYILEVTGQMGIVYSKSADNPTSQITISYNELEENSKYSFRIVTSNVVGNTSTSDKEFFTTDVQNVTATALENAFVVQCDFINGSNAQGCMVVLVGEFDNITAVANLTRINPCKTLTVNVSLNYTHVFGYDIESDGSVGTLKVPGIIILLSRNVSMTCPPIEDQLNKSSSISIIIGVILGLTIIILVPIIAIGVYCHIVKRHPGKSTKTYFVNKCSERRDNDDNIPDSSSGPIYDKPVKDSCTKKDETGTPEDDVANHHYNTTSHINCEEEEKVNISNNNNYGKLNEDSATEHHYFVLENNGGRFSGRSQKESEDIAPDPDAPALPPPFKPEPPPVYQDINGMPYMQEDTAGNEYATVKK